MALATGRDLVTDALADLGVLAEGETPTADALVLGLRRLNDVAEGLNLSAIHWGLPEFDADTDTYLADGQRAALVAALALKLAPTYSRPVTAAMRADALETAAAVNRANLEPVDLTPDQALRAGRRAFNIESGTRY